MSHTRYDELVDRRTEILKMLDTHNFTMELTQEDMESLQAELDSINNEIENLERSDVGV